MLLMMTWKYTRNRIRHELLPLLKDQYHGAADEALLRLQQMSCELQDVIAEIVYPLFQTNVHFPDGGARERVVITLRRINRCVAVFD